MIYDLKQTKKFKEDYKRLLKQKFDETEFKIVLNLLLEGKVLPEKYRDHPLRNSKEYKNCRELHVKPDVVLIYRYYNDKVILYLIRIGSHSNLFSWN